MKEIAAFLAPLAWLVPVVIALVNRAKTEWPALPAWGIVLLAMTVGTVGALVAVYFGFMSLPAKIVVAGCAIGLGASGVFDLFKMFGTFTLKE